MVDAFNSNRVTFCRKERRTRQMKWFLYATVTKEVKSSSRRSLEMRSNWWLYSLDRDCATSNDQTSIHLPSSGSTSASPSVATLFLRPVDIFSSFGALYFNELANADEPEADWHGGTRWVASRNSRRRMEICIVVMFDQWSSSSVALYFGFESSFTECHTDMSTSIDTMFTV